MNTIGSTNPVSPTPKKPGRPAVYGKRVNQSTRYSDRKNFREKKSDKQGKGSIDEYA